MLARILLVATAIISLLAGSAAAQEAIVTYKSLSPELALDLARASLADCRKRGFQVSVAVVDRFGVTQVLLRDRFAGPHTASTATGKAWTAATFRTSTTELNAISQPGMMQAGIRNLPGAIMIAGGLTVEAAGSLLGAVGVSGAPGGDADEACARAGIDAIRDKLDF
ncbi:heme-binding protein [Bradyrhizobium sp. KBS0727]|uniref:GlcG/HbpS family heme-binding protein n=1 Tax=unclassified Bradyrhizobium TaxID=2631580 RepID=UPI00110DA1DA|nr:MULTISPECIES: heme-binding protein [unclassified Bradyrhizobium]QDW40876.1 heme-binding protein [Bradyrhizobium sp. KBS0725]QDW47482.1 heme-binding protein [Bradyrhizobium sp. KBS0727]